MTTNAAQTGLMPDGSGVVGTKVKIAGSTTPQNQHYFYTEEPPLPNAPGGRPSNAPGGPSHALGGPSTAIASFASTVPDTTAITEFFRFNRYSFTWTQLTTGSEPDFLLDTVGQLCQADWTDVRQVLEDEQLTLNLTPTREGLDPERREPALFFKDFTSDKAFLDFIADDNCLASNTLSDLAEYVQKLCIVYPANTPNLLARQRPPFNDPAGAALRQPEKDALFRDAILWQIFWARYASKFKRLRSIELIMPTYFIEDKTNSVSLAQLITEKSLGWKQTKCDLLPQVDRTRERGRLHRVVYERPLAEKDKTFKVVQWGRWMATSLAQLDIERVEENLRPMRAKLAKLIKRRRQGKGPARRARKPKTAAPKTAASPLKSAPRPRNPAPVGLSQRVLRSRTVDAT